MKTIKHIKFTTIYAEKSKAFDECICFIREKQIVMYSRKFRRKEFKKEKMSFEEFMKRYSPLEGYAYYKELT